MSASVPGDSDTLRRLSHLAAMHLTPDEEISLAADLTRMLQAVECLQEAQCSADPELSQRLRLRSDPLTPTPT